MDRDTALDRTAPAVSAATYAILGGGGLNSTRESGATEGDRPCRSSTAGHRATCAGNQVRLIGQQFRIVTFDLRGHGLSDKPAGPEHYADGSSGR